MMMSKIQDEAYAEACEEIEWLKAYLKRIGYSAKYLIWSEEHGAWWCSDRAGYTRSLAQAGRYDVVDAHRILEEANRFLPPGTWHEVVFPDHFETR